MFLILLYKNGKFKKCSLEKMKTKKLDKVEYILIPVKESKNGVSRNFLILDKFDYIDFDHAIIDYQFCVSTLVDDEVVDYSFQPVHKEVNNIIDLLKFMNAIDLLDLVNFTLNGEYPDEFLMTRMIYIGVNIYNEKKKLIYSSHYSMKPSSSPEYMAWKVSSKFKDIYSSCIIIEELKKEKIRLSQKGYWELSIDGFIGYDDGDLIGMPCVLSNTICILTSMEYELIDKMKKYESTISIFYTKKEFVSMFEEYIQKGLYKIPKMIIDNEVDDVFNISYLRNFFKNTTSITHFLDIFSFMDFYITFITTIYEDLYGYRREDEINNYEYDVLVSIIIDTTDNGLYEICADKYTLLDLDDFLTMIGGRR